MSKSVCHVRADSFSDILRPVYKIDKLVMLQVSQLSGSGFGLCIFVPILVTIPVLVLKFEAK